MRHRQPFGLYHFFAIQDQIEIDRARRALVRPLAAESLLDSQQHVENRGSREHRLACRRGIEEYRLRADHANRFGFMERGDAKV